MIQTAGIKLKIGEPPDEARGLMMLQRARWAGEAFSQLDREATQRIALAVAEAAHREAAHYAEWAVQETGFGVAEDKKLKNEMCSRGIYDYYAQEDFVNPRIDPDKKLIEVPRPAGVVFALTPSTNPVSTLFFKILLALMTRNAIVISPHPYAKACCADAARVLEAAAHAAGAPSGIIQVLEEPTIPVITAMMSDPRVDVIVATGGTDVVRAAYRSGNPAFGVGPGNVPVFVDPSADLAAAAERIVQSKSFDNSLLCTNESVLIAEESITAELLRRLRAAGAHVCSDSERDTLRDYLFPDGHLNRAAIGKDATWIAQEAGIRVVPGTRILLAPFEVATPDEPFTHEKLCPVLGFYSARDSTHAIAVASSLPRYFGAGHSAAIHSHDPRNVVAYSTALNTLRVVVNVGCSTGAAGFDTNLAPSMTVGTGFIGRSALGENLRPDYLVNFLRIAYNRDPAEAFPGFEGDLPWRQKLPAAEAFRDHARGLSDGGGGWRPNGGGSGIGGLGPSEIREQIRSLIVDELRQVLAESRRG